MTGVLQSGNVTPGHLTSWVTDGAIKDAGSPITQQKVLGSLFGADFNSTSDQPILIPTFISAFSVSSVIVTNASVSLTTAVGGFYPLAGKAGVAIVDTN